MTDGLVLPADASKLEAEMSKKMKARGVSEWFDGTMTDVWAETTMVGPDRRLRPDRIMTSGGGERTVIVDYKFGRTERAEHRRQVEHSGRIQGRGGIFVVLHAKQSCQSGPMTA